MLFLLSTITYLDRVAISTTAPAMMKELELTPSQMGWVFSIFVFGYALFEIPGGWMADRWGPRAVLTRIVLWWSFFTAATGWVRNSGSLMVVRLLFGVGEAGAFPSCASAVARWFPETERARAQGTLLTGTRIGGAIAPGLVVMLMARYAWRSVFGIFAAAGVVWAVAWYLGFRDTRSGQRVEACHHPPVDWRRLVGSPNLWAICIMYSCYSFGLYFYLTWLPTYLLNARGVTVSTLGLWAGLPLLCGAGGNLAGGWISDHLARRAGLRWGRRIPAGAGLLMSSVLLLVSLALDNTTAALVAMIASFASADLILGPAWATCLDIGKEQVGTVTGCMNSFGQVGGFLSPIIFGWAVSHLGSWTIPLILTAALYFLSATMWLVIDPERPVVFYVKA
jgi:MFS family permease